MVLITVTTGEYGVSSWLSPVFVWPAANTHRLTNICDNTNNCLLVNTYIYFTKQQELCRCFCCCSQHAFCCCSQCTFFVHFARTQKKKFSMSRIGVSFWNALDTKIKLSPSLSYKFALINGIINTHINYQ